MFRKGDEEMKAASTVDVLSDVEVFQSLKRYYESFIQEEIIEVVKDDSDMFVWKEKKSDIKIAISRENFISSYEVRKPWLMYWLERTFQGYNYELDNSKLKFFKDKGFYIDNSAEFLFHYTLIESEYPDNLMVKFNVDDVEFEIGEPSEMFKVMFHHISNDDHFEWENFHTIKLKNVNKEMLESYLQNAMYMIHKNAPSDLVGDYPQVYQYLYTHDYYLDVESTDEIEEIEDIKSFKAGEYPEALAFYNEGKQKRDFLSFYKVLEYFFIINRKEEFESFINDYSCDSDINKVMDKITKVYRKNEDVLLELLLNNVKNNESIVTKAYSLGLTSKDGDIKEFSKKLYAFRNGQVHGKKDTNLELLVPAILNTDKNKDWEIILENLAELVIQQFCFSQIE